MLVQARAASAPVDGRVAVVIPTFDPEQTFDARTAGLPVVGETYLIAVDDDGVYWLLGAPAPPGSGDLNAAHHQVTPAAVWSVDHLLGKHPSCTAFDEAGNQIEGDVKHLSLNGLIITFNPPVAGWVYCN